MGDREVRNAPHAVGSKRRLIFYHCMFPVPASALTDTVIHFRGAINTTHTDSFLYPPEVQRQSASLIGGTEEHPPSPPVIENAVTCAVTHARDKAETRTPTF